MNTSDHLQARLSSGIINIATLIVTVWLGKNPGVGGTSCVSMTTNVLAGNNAS